MRNRGIDLIIEGIRESRENSILNEEDKWITIKGTHVQVDGKGKIKNAKLRKKISSTSKSSRGDESRD